MRKNAYVVCFACGKKLEKIQEKRPLANIGTIKSAKSAVGFQLLFLGNACGWKTLVENQVKQPSKAQQPQTFPPPPSFCIPQSFLRYVSAKR